MPTLGVNIDHVATIRQARRTDEPDPVWAALLAVLGGADIITAHLREDRRHVQERDVRILRETVAVPLNLEMAVDEEIVRIACELKPYEATLVPERRQEVTTEGGLDVIAHQDRIRDVVDRLHAAGVRVSLFIDPEPLSIETAKILGADAVELHTGRYAHARIAAEIDREVAALQSAGEMAHRERLHLHAGHGLTYRNLQRVAAIEGIEEFHIGHSIVSRAVLVGMERAVQEMKLLLSPP
ncbi:MAG: pyridoxine 5'-phosphate synthase [Planctomycetes bacterium]|nr:pyridoxine 5'-phosphate synthase [Planctomycetota bacterium]